MKVEATGQWNICLARAWGFQKVQTWVHPNPALIGNFWVGCRSDGVEKRHLVGELPKYTLDLTHAVQLLEQPIWTRKDQETIWCPKEEGWELTYYPGDQLYTATIFSPIVSLPYMETAIFPALAICRVFWSFMMDAWSHMDHFNLTEYQKILALEK